LLADKIGAQTALTVMSSLGILAILVVIIFIPKIRS
jgi:hypothetical protein